MIKGAKLVVDNLGVDIDGHCIVDGVNFVPDQAMLWEFLVRMGVVNRRYCGRSFTRGNPRGDL